jgi:hypothetical protein
MHQETHFLGRLGNPDFAEWMKGSGGHGEVSVVKTIDELRGASVVT